jgi:hypothetical protein
MGPLNQFEAADVSFDWAVAPFVLERRSDGCFIAAQMSGEGCERRMKRRFAPSKFNDDCVSRAQDMGASESTMIPQRVVPLLCADARNNHVPGHWPRRFA